MVRVLTVLLSVALPCAVFSAAPDPCHVAADTCGGCVALEECGWCPLSRTCNHLSKPPSSSTGTLSAQDDPERGRSSAAGVRAAVGLLSASARAAAPSSGCVLTVPPRYPCTSAPVLSSAVRWPLGGALAAVSLLMLPAGLRAHTAASIAAVLVAAEAGVEVLMASSAGDSSARGTEASTMSTWGPLAGVAGGIFILSLACVFSRIARSALTMAIGSTCLSAWGTLIASVLIAGGSGAAAKGAVYSEVVFDGDGVAPWYTVPSAAVGCFAVFSLAWYRVGDGAPACVGHAVTGAYAAARAADIFLGSPVSPSTAAVSASQFALASRDHVYALFATFVVAAVAGAVLQLWFTSNASFRRMRMKRYLKERRRRARRRERALLGRRSTSESLLEAGDRSSSEESSGARDSRLRRMRGGANTRVSTSRQFALRHGLGSKGDGGASPSQLEEPLLAPDEDALLRGIITRGNRGSRSRARGRTPGLSPGRSSTINADVAAPTPTSNPNPNPKTNSNLDPGPTSNIDSAAGANPGTSSAPAPADGDDDAAAAAVGDRFVADDGSTVGETRGNGRVQRARGESVASTVQSKGRRSRAASRQVDQSAGPVPSAPGGTVTNPNSVRPGEDVLLEEPPAEAPDEVRGAALFRIGGSKSGKWEPRYFETSLRHNRLAVYKSHTDVYRPPLATLRLDRVNDTRQFEQALTDEVVTKRRYLFYVSTPKERWEFSCRSQIELRDWCEALHEAVNFARALSHRHPLPPL